MGDKKHGEQSPEEQEFDEAFAEALDSTPSDAVIETDPLDAPDDGDGAADPGGQDPDNDPDSDGRADDKPADDEQPTRQKPSASADDKPSEPDEIERLEQKIRSAEGRLRKQPNESLRQSIAEMRDQLNSLLDEKSGGFIPDGYSKDEWETFKEDYPDYAANVEKQARETRETKRRLAKVEEEIESEKVQTARKQFLAPIIEAHPDYEDIVKNQSADIFKFVESIKSPIEREVMRAVIEKGTQGEIIDLLGRYKGWRNGGNTPQRRQQNDQSPRSSEINSRVKDLAAVPSRGSQPRAAAVRGRDLDDFDAGFEEALKAT